MSYHAGNRGKLEGEERIKEEGKRTKRQKRKNEE
jgi:hypothetical protein